MWRSLKLKSTAFVCNFKIGSKGVFEIWINCCFEIRMIEWFSVGWLVWKQGKEHIHRQLYEIENLTYNLLQVHFLSTCCLKIYQIFSQYMRLLSVSISQSMYSSVSVCYSLINLSVITPFQLISDKRSHTSRLTPKTVHHD